MNTQEYEKISEMLKELKRDIEIRFDDYIDEIKKLGMEEITVLDEMKKILAPEEPADDKYANVSPEDDIFDQSEREAEREYEKNEIDSHLHKI